MTVVYTLYNLADGVISDGGFCPNEECLPVKPEGFDFLFGVAGHPETQRVENGVLVPYDRPREPEALVGAIESERKRRLAVGFDYPFGDERGTHRIGTTKNDLDGWDEVTKLAQAYINAGMPTSTIAVVTDTGPAVVTAEEWQQVLIAAAAFRQPIYAKSFVLQDLDPIPQDVENPEYWT